ncbi:hypothetical protein [Halobaculum sp. D14]|uniref:hypothetical protein n=1 Tax=unclassified Halobaculum TaxID=2640896 RepID=UPI003EBAAFC6
MGRTNPTYRRFLESYEQDWSTFRRALRAQHRDDFDRLFERAAEHAAAAGMQNPTDPTEALLVSLLVAHETEIRRLRARLDSVEGGDAAAGAAADATDAAADATADRPADE